MKTLKRGFAVFLAGIFVPICAHCGGVVSSATESALNTALSGGGTVTFASDMTITITSVKTISANTMIDGSGHKVTISGGNSVGILNNSYGVALTLNNLTLANGRGANGSSAAGAVYNQGALLASNCIFSSNQVVGANGSAGGTGANGSGSQNGSPGGNGTIGGEADGAAVFNEAGGTASFLNCVFSANTTTGGNGGNGGKGGNAGPSGFNGGAGGNGGDGGPGYGGAVFNNGLGILSLTNCTFTNNLAVGGNAGAAGTNGTGPLYSPPGAGGNGAVGEGGSVYNAGGMITIYACTFNTNAALGGNTATAGVNSGNLNGLNGNPGGNGYGGAVCNIGTNPIINCTFLGNIARGGKGGNGGPSDGRTGGNGGTGGSGVGGNVYNAAVLGVTNATIAGGSCPGGAGGLGDTTSPIHGSNGSAGSGFGANIANDTGGTLNLKNSLLASPTNAANAYAAATITDAGNNLSSDSTPSFTQSNSYNTSLIGLSALANNGGPTLTMALSNGSPAIGLADTNAAPSQDQRGYYWVESPSSGAYDYGAVAVPAVGIIALGPTASEDGDVGVFFIERSTYGPPGALTVNLNIAGSATNGVNYATITNTITIPAGQLSAQILVQAMPGTFIGTNRSVVLTISTNSQYSVVTNLASATVLLQVNSTFDSSARFVRGTTTAPDFQSFVVPLDGQLGIPLSAVGGNAASLFPGNPWTTNFYHYNGTNLTSQTGTNGRIVFQNPIVAFGSPVGGSPLYLNQNYDFGIGAGNLAETLSNGLRVQVYNRSNSSFAGTISMPIPNAAQLSQLTGLVTNGFTQTFTNFGLQTTILVSDFAAWGLAFGNYFVLTHTATAAATNFYYVVEEQGFAPNNWLVLNQSGYADWSKLYAMEFSPVPPGRPTFVDQPQFNGVPLPPSYLGMSVQELTNVVPSLPNLSSLNPSNYLTIDGSPELRRHPTLDQFVADMNNDPLALANYVINEIDLIDAIDYDTNYNGQAAVNVGGVDRGALATFQEGQGSPVEQCALLIYLLRQAGVPAAYVYPSSGGLQMLDSQLSKLLRVQLQGALSPTGETNMPQLISVNYPWVAAYVGSQWVQIFPWMKDTEIIEGLDLYDYMPANYNSGYKWLTHFIAGDTNIFSLSESDQPLDLLPLFIQQNLDANFPGLSVDDLGVQIVNRRHLYSQWSDFPLPFALSGTPSVIESLSTNLSLFNTLEIVAYSQANPSKSVDTTEMRVMDFHNRKLLLEFDQLGGSNLHNMVVTLSPYSTNITGVAAFSTTADSTWQLSATNLLNSSDDNIVFQVTHKRNKFLPSNYIPATTGSVTNLWNFDYFEQGEVGNGQTYFTTNNFRKGDWIAFGLDAGRVSQKMLNVWAQDIWQFNQTAGTNSLSNLNPDIYVGTTAYLTAMSYFNYVDRFADLNNNLHKVALESSFQYGFGLVRPERTTTGALVNNGAVIPILPAVHMPNNGQATVFNNGLRPDSGRDSFSTFLDWWLQRGVQGSAAEHGVLRGYYQTNAISSVKLLQQAGTNTLALNLLNYAAIGTSLYNGVELENADPNLWSTIVQFFATQDYDREVFITPGTMTNGTFVGMGAILLSSDEFDSPVSGLNGGIADDLPPGMLAQTNAPYVNVIPAPAGATAPYILLSVPQANNPADPIDGATTSPSLPGGYNILVNNPGQADLAFQQAAAQMATTFGSVVNSASAYYQSYDAGAGATAPSANNDPSERASDPVNVMNGEFYIDSADITLPGPMPLQIRRNYGSQNLAENEFGFGWKISYIPFLSVGTNSTLIYAAEMDGSFLAYRQTSTNANVWLPTAADNPTLNNNSGLGIGSVGNLFNNRLQMAVVSGTNVFTLTGADGSLRTFTQRSYPIGSFARQRPYLDTWFDNRGNSYSFEYGTNPANPDYGQVRRIQSSNGNFVGFYYDLYGHIIEAYTGDGRRLEYDYDKYGDLITVTLPDQSEISYQYQHLNQVTNSVTNLYSTHLIIEEDKPNGRVLQNNYDSQRRVTNQLATVGTDLVPIRNATFAYTNNFSLSSPTNLLTGVTGVYDYTNNLTTYYYTNSLIRKIVDPLNQTIIQNWFESDTNGGYRRSLQSRIDKRGLQTAYQYDTFGNVLTNTLTGDLLGVGNTNDVAVTTATYNGNNLPTLIVDPVGNETQIIYDTTYAFLPQQIIRLAGTTPVTTNLMVYTSASTVVTVGTNVSTNSAFGLLTRTIRAYGSTDAATSDAFFNGQGFVTNTIQYTGTADPNITNQLIYDERGELIQRTDGAGRVYKFLYDPMGRPAGHETYEAGATTPMDFSYAYYNENGNLTWTDGPRYNPEDYIWRDYDGAGRKITEIHWRSEAKQDGGGVEAASGNNLYATIFYQYDPFGNLIRTIDPLGNYVVQNFDAIGQMTKEVFYASNGTAMKTNGFAYEPGGLVSSMTNAAGGVTRRIYSSTGKLEVQINPDGSTYQWTYFLDGRANEDFLPSGTYYQREYVDSTLSMIKFIWNSQTYMSPRLETSYFDHRGNRISFQDLEGNIFTNSYDGLDRTKIAAGPAIITLAWNGIPGGGGGTITNINQMITGTIYDASGQVLTTTNALGEKTVTTGDALGRPTQRAIYPSNTVTPVRVTSTFYHPDHQSVTVTNGTGTDAIVTTTYTDNDGRTLLTIGSPASGVTEFNWWQYDLAGNLIAQQHCSSNSTGITVWATNGWTYDGLNRALIETSKDGASTTNSYDALNDVTSRAMPSGLTWNATYLNDGRIATENETGGAATARSFSYTYYASNSALAGRLRTVVDGRSVTRSNAYDELARLTNVTTFGSQPAVQTATIYQYDWRNLVTNVLQSFITNTTGPSTQTIRDRDAYGRIVAEYEIINNQYNEILSQDWDPAGRRTSLDFGTEGIFFAYRADGLMTAAKEASFGYADNGLLQGRTNSARSYAVTQRDGLGRILQTVTRVGSQTPLTENLSWRNDGLLSNYVAVRSDTTLTNDTRAYGYSTFAQRVTSETFNIASGQSVTNAYGIDNGATGGLGILTAQIQSGSFSSDWNVLTNGGLDGVDRLIEAQDSLINRPAYGLAMGAAVVKGTLDGRPLNIQFDGPEGGGQWSANMALVPGAHTLQVSAADPSGLLSATTNCSIASATNSGDTILAAYDGNGNTTQRFWVNSLGITNRSQTLTWDAFDRLIAVVDRDAVANGFNWTAVYDALGRRLQTVNTQVISNTPVTSLSASNQASQVDSSYDPEVTFLEVGVTVNGAFTSKTYGPDVNGAYGGLQGVGGLESISVGGYLDSIGTVQDLFGNILGTITNGVVAWNSARFSSYGPVPGFQSPSLSLNVNLAQSTGWRGKREDETGLIYLGMRMYDPVAGRFLNADPLGNSASMDLYSFCGGDPVNRFDPSGRAVIQAWQQTQQNLINQGGFWNNAGAYGISFGITALNAFSFGSFAKNDALLDQNLAGNISDSQFWTGAAANSGIAATKLAISVGGGYAAATGTAGYLSSLGAPTVVTAVGSGVAGGLAGDFSGQTVGIIAGDQRGYNLTELAVSGAIGGGVNFAANYAQSSRLLMGQLGNREIGQIGEQQAAQDITESGENIRAAQARLTTPEGNPRVDYVVDDPTSPSGVKGVEVKTGDADLSYAQEWGYPEVRAGNGQFTGSVAEDAGLPVDQPLPPTPIDVLRYQPYELLPFNVATGGALGAGVSSGGFSVQQDPTGKHIK